MALQFRRGLDADRTSITPLPGEPLWITDTPALYIGDGATAGGVLITSGGGGGAPTNADYLVKTANGTLTAERVVTDSTSITANWATGGQVAFERAALTGDVTASANGNATTIANDAVTFAKMQNIATDKLLGRATAGSGDVEEITCTSAGRALLDDADAAAQRTTLGLGTIATQAASSVTITGGSLEGVTVTTGTYSSKVNEAIMQAVRKETAGTISKGDVIRITGSSGTHLQVELADASAEATSTGTIGIAATTITNSTTGYMMVAGELTGLSNVPTASFTNGAALWLSETTGGFTTTRPTQPAHGVFLGWVVEANNGSAGRIYVKVINYPELNELHDVLISGAADNHFLVYDNATSLWKNESPSDARTSLGLGTVATESTVPINKGGTGQTTATAAFDALAPTTTKGDIIVFDGTDNIRLAVGGTNDHVLTVDSSTATGLKWAAAPGGTGGGTKTYAVFTPLQAQPPASNFATLDTRNNISVLEFDGGTTDESTTFIGIMPEAASLGSGLKVRIHWMADTATSGNVRWGVQFEDMVTDLDSDSFDTAVEANGAANGTSGIPTMTEITITTIDSIVAGDAFRLRVYREASDTTNDTMSGDAQLIAVEVRSAA